MQRGAFGDHGSNIFGGAGQDCERRSYPVMSQAVTLVGPKLDRICDELVLSDQRGKSPREPSDGVSSCGRSCSGGGHASSS